jgi:PIN domain nuclease of toxin-antitoxin system
VAVILLDTHTWIWSVEGDVRRIGRKARALLARAEAEERIRISPVSVFEIMALATSGRLRLSQPVETWIRDSLATAGVRVAELTPAVALDAGAIPRSALADPLDRFLVATARQLQATFLTSDARILTYAAATTNVRVHDAAV